MESSIPDSGHIDIRLVSSDKRYAVADIPYSVPSDVDTVHLNSLLKGIINKDRGEDSIKHVEFEFLINSQFLRVPLIQHIEEKNLTTESVTEVEYIVKECAPQPKESLLHNDWVSCLHSNNKWLLCGCYDNNTYMWDLTSQTLVHTVSDHHQGAVKSVVIIPNEEGSGSLEFASGSQDQTIRIFRRRSGEEGAGGDGGGSVVCTQVFRGHAESVDTLALHPHSTHLLASGSTDNTIKLWNLAAGSGGDVNEESSASTQKRKKRKSEHVSPSVVVTKLPKFTIASHQEAVTGLCWRSDNDLLSASWDHTIRLWDMNTGEQLQLLQGSKSFLAISYSRYNKLIISGSVDRHIRLWDPREGNILVKSVFTSHTGWVSAAQWANTDQHTNHNLFITGSYDNIAKLWDIRCCKVPLYDMSGHDEKVLCCDWSNPGYILSGGADSKVKIFTLPTSHAIT